ncbi:MAG: hypothetical protein R6W77_02580 [Trueperaceae bacterium]
MIRALLPALACAVTLLIPLAASAARAAGLPLPPEPTFADYLASFDAAFTPPDHVTLALVDAEAGVLRAERAAGPRVGMEQSLRLNDYSTVAYGVSTDVTVPLYAAHQNLDVAIAAATLEHQRASAETARAEARARFAGDVLALALLTHAATDVERALERARADGWPGTSSAADATQIPPDARDAYLQERKLTDLLGFLRANVEDLRRSLARAMDLEPAGLGPPEADATLAAFMNPPPSHARCMIDAPSAADARARHERRTLQDALTGTPVATIDLVAGLGVRSGSGGAVGASGSEVHGSIGLEARIAAPSTWPVTGDATAAIDLVGMRQALRIEWPSRPTPVLQAGRSADLVLEDELEALETTLRSLRRAHQQAMSRRAERELRLAWFVHDVLDSGGTRASYADDREPLPDPIADLHAAELRTNLTFARLDEALAWIELLLACGVSV